MTITINTYILTFFLHSESKLASSSDHWKISHDSDLSTKIDKATKTLLGTC